MASNAFQYGLAQLLNGQVDWLTADIKMMLVNSTYTPNKDQQFIDEAGANDAIDGEIGSVTNYTGGFGGAGRKSLTGKTITIDNVDDEVVFDANDLTWTSLGGASNDTITASLMIFEITNDLASILISNNEATTPTLTDGNNLSTAFNVEGLVNFNT